MKFLRYIAILFVVSLVVHAQQPQPQGPPLTPEQQAVQNQAAILQSKIETVETKLSGLDEWKQRAALIQALQQLQQQYNQLPAAKTEKGKIDPKPVGTEKPK